MIVATLRIFASDAILVNIEVVYKEFCCWIDPIEQGFHLEKKPCLAIDDNSNRGRTCLLARLNR